MGSIGSSLTGFSCYSLTGFSSYIYYQSTIGEATDASDALGWKLTCRIVSLGSYQVVWEFSDTSYMYIIGAAGAGLKPRVMNLDSYKTLINL